MLCYLPIETKVRDLDARLYLALLLVQRGWTCVLGGKSGVCRHMFACGSPYVYIAKGARWADANRRQLRETGGVFVVLDEEGGVSGKALTSFAMRHQDELLKHIDLYFAWGERQRQFLLKERASLPDSKITVSGNPRFDLCKTTFVSYYRAIADDLGVPDDCVLIDTKFTAVNHQLGTRGKVRYNIGMWGTRFIDRRRYRASERYQKEVFDHFVLAVKAVAAKYPRRHVVVRAHPAEEESTYKRLFSNIPNILIDRRGPAEAWITKAAVLIHHDCTTGIQGMFARKPVISYCPVLDEDMVQWLPVAAGYRVQSLDDLLETMDGHIIKKYEPEHFIRHYDYELIKQYIANTEFDAADAIVEALEQRRVFWQNEWHERTNLEESVGAKGAQDGSDKVTSVENGQVCIGQAKPRPSGLRRLQRKMLIEGRNWYLRKEGDVHAGKLATLRRNKFDNLCEKEIKARIDVFKKMGCIDCEISVTVDDKDVYALEKK